MNSKTLSKERSERARAWLFLAITAIMWSLGGLLIKSVNAHPLAISGIRSIISAVIIFAYVKKPKFTWSFAQIGAALAYAMTVILFVVANKLTTAANAILLQYTAPVYVALLGAWLLKEKAKLLDWVTIGVVIGGMVLFFMDHLETRGILGNILALLSGVSFGLFAVLMRMQKDGSPIESVLLGNIISAVIGLPFLAFGVPDATGWICLILLGVVQLGIPYILYSSAIKKATALEASLIPVLEPLLNPLWVFLRMGEAPGLYAFIGGLVVLLAVTARCVIEALSSDVRDKRKKTSAAVKNAV